MTARPRSTGVVLLERRPLVAERTDPAQEAEAVDAVATAARPRNVDGVVAHRGDLRRLDVAPGVAVRDRSSVALTARARAVAAEEAVGRLRLVAVVPGQEQRLLLRQPHDLDQVCLAMSHQLLPYFFGRNAAIRASLVVR